MDFIPKTESHWSKDYVAKMKHFALVLVDNKDRIIRVLGEHWNKEEGPVTKRELRKYKEEAEKTTIPRTPWTRYVWTKTDYGQLFFETDEEELPDSATTELTKYLVIWVDEYGNKSISENPITDEFGLWKAFYEVARKVADLEGHWRIYDKTRIPEIYELKEGFIAQRLSTGWKSYDIESEPIVYNARADRDMVDELQNHKKENGEQWEFITMGDAFDWFLKKFE